MGARIRKSLTAVFILALAMAPFADAGQIGRPRGNDIDRGRNSTRHDYDEGYRDGLRRGAADARSGRPFGGTLFSARRAYGDGFAAGYREGYERERAIVTRVRQGRIVPPARSGGRGYREPAFAAGFESGYEKGIKDARDGDRYDPVRHRDYRDAERGFKKEYGSRDAYRTNFRAGFRQGYEEGYRTGTRNRR